MKEKKLAKVLIVDDLATNVDLIKAYLEEEGYAILTASNGKEAWEIAQKELPDIILLDVMMPIMDGYEACRLIKGNKSTENIPVVIITSLSETSSRIEGLEAGADDFLSKPFNIYELLARVKSLVRIKKYYTQILDQNRVFQEELEIAKKVQEAILPSNNFKIEGLSLNYKYIPCKTVGGDYFNFVQLPDNQFGIFLSDVMGHGVAGSLITMVLKTFFDSLVRKVKKPSDFLFELNNELQTIFGDILIYATAIYLIIDLKNKKLLYSNGGHPSALLFNQKKSEIEELKCKGTILGIFKDATYETYERKLDMNDQVLLYTDGITDVEDSNDRMLGDERLHDIVKQNKALDPKKLIEILLKEVYKYAKEEHFEDDINLICFRLDS